MQDVISTSKNETWLFLKYNSVAKSTAGIII